MGTWTAGIPSAGINSSLNFISAEMEEKVAINRAKKVYKVVAVMQPPFMLWNDTRSINISHEEQPVRSHQLF